MANRDFQIDLKLKADTKAAEEALARAQAQVKKLTDVVAKANGAGGGATPPVAKGFDATAKSARELQFATRGLPSQFTDIFTSLQGGQRPLNVLLQQGGQLKDMFGGIGPAARAMGGYVLGLINPFTVAAAAVVALGFAINQAQKETAAFNQALILTGNYANSSSAELAAMAQDLDATTVASAGKASEVIAQVASTGKFTAEQIGLVAAAAINMQDATGKAIDKTIAEFVSLTGDPVDAILKLNDTQHFLTQETLDQIQTFKEQGREADATAVAISAYADTINQRAPEVTGQLTTWGALWRDISTAAREAGDELVQVFRESDRGAKEAITSAAAFLATINPLAGIATTGFAQVFNAYSAQAQAARARPDFSNVTHGGDTVVDSRTVRAALDFQQQGLRYATEQARMEKDIADAKALGLKAGKSQVEIDARIAAIRKSYADKAPKPKKEPKSDAEKAEEAAARELGNLQKQVALLGSLEEGETKVSEAARIRYEIQNGAYKAASPALQKQLLAEADLLDANRRKLDIAKQLQSVNLDVLRLQGNDAAAAIQKTLEGYRKLRAELAADGNAAGVAQVDTAIDLTQKKAELDVMRAQADAAFTSIQRQTQQIQARQQAGLLTEYEAQQQIVDLYHDQGAVIEQMLPQMEAMAQALGPEAVESVARIRAELEGMSQTTSLLQQQIGSTFQGAFSNALEALVTRTASLREAVSGFFLDMSRGFARMASQALAQGAWKKILGVFGVETDVGDGADKLQTAAAATTAAGASISAGAVMLSSAAAALAAAGGVSAASGAAGAAGSSGGGNWMSSLLGLFSSFFAEGGAVSGPGTSTSDSILARLSDGEFVARAAVVSQPGALAFLSDFNHRGMAAIEAWAHRFDGASLPSFSLPRIPRHRFAEGGLAMAGGGGVNNDMRVYLSLNEDDLAQRLANHPALAKAIVAVAGENGQAIRATW